eukprot:1194040-Prorocentrum_minimum.AAC.1
MATKHAASAPKREARNGEKARPRCVMYITLSDITLGGFPGASPLPWGVQGTGSRTPLTGPWNNPT